MILLAMLMLFAAGFLLMSYISPRFSLTERIGFGFPIGLALVTFLMMLQDWAGLPLTAGSCMTLTVVALAGTALANIPQRKAFLQGLKPQTDFSWFNMLWVLMLCILVWVEYHNMLKCMYFPVYDRDSMAGFDTIGYIAAQEHTYKNISVFTGDYMPKMHAPGSCISYMPMLQLAYAYIYSLGAETSKLIPGLFYLSFIIGFYGMATRTMSHTAAMMATLGMVFTPEMISFSSLSGTNVMQATMASTGLVYVCIWANQKKNEYLYLGCLLLAINHWLRAEGIAFGGAAGLIVLIQCLRKQASWKQLSAPVLTLIPTIVFLLYSNSSGLTSENALITRFFWDGEKVSLISQGVWELLSQATFYGWTFIIMLLVILANAYFSVMRRDNLFTLLAFFVSLLLYYIILYQVDYKWDSINNVLAYSAKRYMFCYVPVAWYFICNARITQMLFNWIEKTCGRIAQ